MGVVTITLLVDSQIGFVADFIPEQLSSSTGVDGFIGIAIIFAVTQYFILVYIKQSNRDSRVKAISLDLMHSIVSTAQYVLVGLLALVTFQVIVEQQYSIVTLVASYVISYGLWILILALLTKAFFSWYRLSNKNIMVLILALSMIAYVVNGITGLANYSNLLLQQKSVITSKDIAYFPEFSIAALGTQINIVYQIAGAAAYVLTWVGAVKLLYPYVKELGRVKFWTIMGAAMVYYLINFPLFVLGYFNVSENVDAMTNILIFSLASVFTGIVFGAAFLSVARTLRRDTALRAHMIIAAYGFVLFYIAGSATAAQAAYPPYGLASVSLVGLSCYLIYSGLYSSATIVSQDTTLRQSIRRSATEQSKLLDSMGTAHMEQELQSRVLTIARKNSDVMAEETGVETSMTEEDMKEYLDIVMKELHSK
jgi:hypothetical protein